ncbi:P-loop NTPase fold protein [Flavobacterium sp. XS2P24]|uniref:KAP family P-loop NTPase fold protein n=1 Tax=Flavobacterium sp. XS2P24 TaxID=3041249 RepID=UPI0024A912E0|nr:P-loop NTPase fold protein [Flavobacterium sp. XS2P24]MDI6049384.1 P-loop NTPase fold protein [Flavobacterium sp. XS2P24]
MSDSIHFLGDNAINKPEEDLFNFKHYAEKVQKLIQLNSGNTEPITIGIYGKWGEGKTSFLNLIENKIDHFEKKEGDKEYLKFHFNPWRYSSEDEMLFDFFDSLSKKIYVKENTNLQEVGKWISKYSKYLKAIKISATVGIPKIFNSKVSFDVNEIFQALGEDLEGDKLTLDSLKDKVNEAIKKVNFKVVVFIDDLDRLDKEEIYTILKLIKLNANFDNFIFIVNLDSEQVAKAIKHRYGDEILDGKLFLEKIINIPINLPKIENEDLQFFFETKFSKLINLLVFNDFESRKNEVDEIKQGFSAQFFKSPREIIRVLNGFFIGAFSLGDEINLRDLFWIEWLKIKNVKLYDKIKSYNSSDSESFFTGQNEIIDFNDKFDMDAGKTVNRGEYLKGTREKLIKEFEEYKWIVDLLFPNQNNIGQGMKFVYDTNLNINSTLHFDKYFSYHTERKVKNTNLLKLKEQIINKKSSDLLISIKELFSKKIENQKSLYSLENVIKSMNIIENRNFLFDFLFKNIDVIPETQKDMFEQDYRSRIIKLIGRQLNDDKENNNEKITIELANNLSDLDQLLNFIISFDEKKSFKKNIELLFLKKSKERLGDEIAFYKDSEKILNRWFLDFWHKYEPEVFKDYIDKSLTNIDNIKHLIRNFSVIFNGKKFGALSKEKYDYMGEIINSDFLFSKIQEFDNKMIETVDISKFEFDNYDESTLEFNIKQFIYWYKKEQELKEQELYLAAFGKIKP